MAFQRRKRRHDGRRVLRNVPPPTAACDVKISSDRRAWRPNPTSAGACRRYAPAVPCQLADPWQDSWTPSPVKPMSLVAAPLRALSLPRGAGPLESRQPGDCRNRRVCQSLHARVGRAVRGAAAAGQVPGQSLTTVEAALLCALGAWDGCALATRTLPAWRPPLTLPWLLVARRDACRRACCAVSPGQRLQYGRAASSFAFGVYLLGVNGILTAVRLRTVLAATASAGAVVAVLAAARVSSPSTRSRFLSLYSAHGSRWSAPRSAPSGPLQYPTIASMFLEIAFAFALGLMLIGDGRTAPHCGGVAFRVVAAVIGQANRLHVHPSRPDYCRLDIGRSSRGCVIGGPRFDRGMAVLAIVAVLFGVQLLSSRSPESLRLRLTTETQDAWFRAEVRHRSNFNLSREAVRGCRSPS